MEWNGQQSQTPQHGLQPVADPEPLPSYLDANPLHGQAAQVLPPAPAISAIASSVPLAQPAAASARLDDDTTDVNDAEWVSRAKRTIAGTRGDPHRQVQLIQHLRSQYLKQRFGRTVHTDEA